MAAFDWVGWADGQTEGVRARDRWRAPRAFDTLGPEGRLVAEDRDVVSFASNDYLGLTAHPAVIAAAHEALDRWGSGSGSARLVVGSRPVHHELEVELAAWRGTDRAVLFPTGFAANLGVLSTVGGRGVRILSDELNHASIIDGVRLSRSRVEIYPHKDLEHLGKLLGEGDEPTVVVTDTVFSMDGDVADLDALLPLCATHRALVVLDEAHAVLGPDVPESDAVVLRVGTLSKALGSLGGFVAGPRAFCELLENRARSYIFTTASTPADSAAALAALRVVRSDEGEQLRDRLRRHVDAVTPGHPSPIVPVIIGPEEQALRAARTLLDRGLWVPAIRPPTVAPGSSRLRIALSASHTEDQVLRLTSALADLELVVPVTASPLVLVVAGTGTEIGKTWVAAGLAQELRAAGRTVRAHKPAQSFEPHSGPTDADVLAAATDQLPEEVCPPHRWYRTPMAPPMAAEVMGCPPFSVADLMREVPRPPTDIDVLLVESAGGVRSPLASDGDTVDLVRGLRPDRVLLVADAALGTINAVRLSSEALDPAPVVVFLNRFDADDELHRRNRSWLADRCGYEVETALTALGALVDRLSRDKVDR